MSARVCRHESEVVQAVLTGRWPAASALALQEHANACAVCREVVAIVPLLRAAYDEARDAVERRYVPMPSAGQIWGRAAVHARADAARAAARPLVWGYGVAAAAAAGLSAAGVSVMRPWLRPAVEWVGAITEKVTPAADIVVAALRAQLPTVIAVAVCAIAAPVALYFALREDS
jgi:hypothetical protein